MEREKLKSNKIPVYLSEKIYDVLVKICGANNNHYEKETFIYHHSIVNHSLKKYVFKGNDESIWEIYINEKNDILSCKDENLYTKLNLANKIINYILYNKGKFYFS